MSKTKIAILGGGMSAMTTAFYLTSPEAQDKYEVTVYQLGWRLGGKGASGRNRDIGDRIEEHGLHIWMGFYENAFSVMRDAYKEMNRPHSVPLATLDEAFKKQSYIVLDEQLVNGTGPWYPWTFDFPTNTDKPGTGGLLPSPLAYAEILIGWIFKLWSVALFDDPKTPEVEDALSFLPDFIEGHVRDALSGVQQEIGGILGKVGMPHGQLRPDKVLLERIVALSKGLGSSRILPGSHSILAALIRAFMDVCWVILRGKVFSDINVHKLWVGLNLAGSAAAGILSDDVFTKGWDSIDDLDLRAWLAKYGANQVTLDSAPLRGIYDLVFGYVSGQVKDGRFAAGTAMRGIMRMLFTYKGAIFFKMQAGMGDTVFTPLYEVLKKRGVTFKFFHRVKNLKLSPDKNIVDEIELVKQVDLKDEALGYDPLFTTPDGLPCWPSDPNYDQIVKGDKLKASGINLESSWAETWEDEKPKTLKMGVDYDQIVLGISIGAFPFICKELIDAKAPFKRMVNTVLTNETAGIQLWFKPDLAGLGWKVPPSISERPVLGSFVEPIDTWADMSQLLPRETWPPSHEPHNVAYLCGPYAETKPTPPFSDHGYPDRELLKLRTMAVDFLNQDSRFLWPDVNTTTSFNFDELIDLKDRSGEARIDGQYLRVNIDPSERYVLSVPNSTQNRLRADDSGFVNVFLSGDWTANGFNAGCIEAATMGGMFASRAICGLPAFIIGEEDR